MAKRNAYGAFDPNTLGPGFAPGGTMSLAQAMGYPELADKMGDLAFYGANLGDLVGILHGEQQYDQAAREAGIKMLLGLTGDQTHENVANINAGAQMYGADQNLAGHKFQAEAQTGMGQARNLNAFQIATLKAKEAADAAAQAAQARIQAAMLHYKGSVDSANIRNQGAMNTTALKVLPPEMTSKLGQLVMERSGGDVATAMSLWKQILGSRGYDPNTPFPQVK